jgi:hypothetical protein
LLRNPNNERTWVTREHDPECLSCHVTGWNPQGYYPYVSGFLKIEDSRLHANGCENCHGPCSAHVELENQIAAGKEFDKELRKKLTREIKVTLKQAKETNLCLDCHDLDNSPEFDFDKYWPLVDHGRKARNALEAAKKAATETR